jgi:hypothetical protein
MNRKELKQRAREEKPVAAVYQIRNLRNGRVLVESTLNLRTLNGRRLTLASGTHPNARLRADVAALGPEAFALEVLQVLEEDEDGLVWRRDALRRLEAEWIERLRPWDERGYHLPPRPREPAT